MGRPWQIIQRAKLFSSSSALEGKKARVTVSLKADRRDGNCEKVPEAGSQTRPHTATAIRERSAGRETHAQGLLSPPWSPGVCTADCEAEVMD